MLKNTRKHRSTTEKLKKNIAEADLQLAFLEEEVERLHRDLQLLQSSTSWRITAPIRKCKTLAGKIYQVLKYRRHWMKLAPRNDLKLEKNGVFQIVGRYPQVSLTSNRQKMPVGLVNISGRVVGPAMNLELHIADENGFSADKSLILSTNAKGHIRQLIQLPGDVRALRLDILTHEGGFTIDRFKIVEIDDAWAVVMQLREFVSQGVRHPGQSMQKLRKGIRYFRINGLSATLKRMKTPRSGSDYQKWVKDFSTITANDQDQIAAHIKKMAYTPVISIIMPVYNTPRRMLMAAIESVQNQLYPNWELCIADDASTLPHIREVLEEYRKNDARIKLVFREENGHISACSNSALTLVTGEFTALLDHDDKLSPHALYMVAHELNQYPDADIIYSDEDKVDNQGNRFSPHFKPDWNPELFFSANYLSHLGIYRTDLIRSVNGFRQGMEGSQDYDLVLRCLMHTEFDKIRHIPHILYHWRAVPGSTALNRGEKDYATTAGVLALQHYFKQIDPDIRVAACDAPTTYRVRYPVKTEPGVCIIIPTKNNHNMLKKCVDSIWKKTEYSNYTLAIVNNQSDQPATLAYLKQLEKHPGCRVLNYDYPFNYSAINNFAVENTSSDMVCLMNDDIEVISPDWLSEMVAHALRPDVGAVGAKLLYPDNRVQHAGVILGLGGVAGHSHKYTDTTHNAPGYFYRLQMSQMISAVTAACLLVRRQVYEQVGGLDHRNLKIAFNDVDFCLRIRQAGFRNVWTPYALLYHHESVSRGLEDTREKQKRFSREVAYMKKTWRWVLKNDPCYNPNLTDATEDFALGFPSRAKKPWQVRSRLKYIKEFQNKTRHKKELQ